MIALSLIVDKPHGKSCLIRHQVAKEGCSLQKTLGEMAAACRAESTAEVYSEHTEGNFDGYYSVIRMT